MAGFKGRAIAYPVLLISGWIAGRVTYLGAEQPVDSAIDIASPLPTSHQNLDVPVGPDPTVGQHGRSATVTLRREHASEMRGHRIGPNGPTHRGSNNPADKNQLALLKSDPSLINVATQTRDAPAGESTQAQLESGGRWFGYGYSFWRIGRSDGAIAAPGGQYGGSQSGLILGYDLGGRRDHGLALLARAAATPGRNGEEAAFGLRWQRPAALPFSLTAERRIVLNGKDRWAAYAAGGIDQVTLPLGFKLDAYGQSGWTSGKNGGAFFDVQGRAMRNLTEFRGIALKAGAGAWAGGQRGTQRLDVGPALAAEIPIARTKLDLRLDWRQRVAGNARPGSGAAITLATGF